ncbi:MAG: hypothetical protein A2622_06550 [Bdellovibrionales bacterium RIFCSPHIGHO2_01_FULL_40_29]|nr:MAG: hypothetical protein A2622_06550 [Bdellovibrionales bacterium RIFCSPHIGHO2_01_FULL_40_29]OFZ35102.1 MAG: hypothetical protein A3D17_06900 [Bdellovibrionales bacterium RIFCSPHIGHO2_02_FULL_40_15]
MKAIYWVIGASIVALGIFISVSLDSAQRTVPKIKLSYFADEVEIAQNVLKRLQLEIGQNPFYWVGVEPDKTEQIAVVVQIKNEIEKLNGPFVEVIADSELKLSAENMKLLGVTQNVFIKENIINVGEVLTKLEQQNKKYFLVTASLYTNTFIKENPTSILKKNNSIKPMTVSMAYFATNPEQEKNILFPCDTEDKSGTSAWGCVIVTKARSVRRKYEKQNIKPWVGLMDLTGGNDYMLLIQKK